MLYLLKGLARIRVGLSTQQEKQGGRKEKLKAKTLRRFVECVQRAPQRRVGIEPVTGTTMTACILRQALCSCDEHL